MAQINDSADVHECETALDANWNERKHLIDEQFALRLEIQALLVNGDGPFEEVRQRELLSKAAVQADEDEYDAIVCRWAAGVGTLHFCFAA